jgi:tRNA threonylcarbamoyladenosine biosynthesis protein TsaB
LREHRVAVAIETSGVPSAAAAAAGRIAEVPLDSAAVHGRGLLPALRECLGRVGASPGGIDLVVVGTGPGSYTGLRVGIAAAKTIAYALRCPIVALPSADALAEGAPSGESRVAVAIDAKRGEVFASLHARDGDRFDCIAPPRLLSPDGLARLAGSGALAVGGGAILHARALREAGLRVAGEELARARADVLLQLGMRHFSSRGGDPLPSVQPLYLRMPAAVEKRAGSAQPPAAGP